MNRGREAFGYLVQSGMLDYVCLFALNFGDSRKEIVEVLIVHRGKVLF